MHRTLRAHVARQDARGARAPRRVTAAVVLLLLATGCSGGAARPGVTPAGEGTPSITPPAGALPGPSPSVPAPDPGSAVGALPDDFPGDLLPLPPRAEILVATYAPEVEPGPAQPYAVSLNVRTSLPVEEVIALYRSSLTAAGFTESTGAGASLTAESTFSRSAGQEIVVVGVLDRDGTRTVTVGGRIRAAG